VMGVPARLISRRSGSRLADEREIAGDGRSASPAVEADAGPVGCDSRSLEPSHPSVAGSGG
jgi:hypothetical protein